MNLLQRTEANLHNISFHIQQNEIKIDHSLGILIYSYTDALDISLNSKTHHIEPFSGYWIPSNCSIEKISITPKNYCLIQFPKYTSSLLPSFNSIVIFNEVSINFINYCKKNSIDTTNFLYQSVFIKNIINDIKISKTSRDFLPTTNHKTLIEILKFFQLNPNVSTTKVSENFKINERMLSRMFNKELGISPTEWKKRFRLQNSIKYLSDGLTIEEISRSLGYSRTYIFEYNFKKWTGSTPKKYLKLIKT